MCNTMPFAIHIYYCTVLRDINRIKIMNQTLAITTRINLLRITCNTFGIRYVCVRCYGSGGNGSVQNGCYVNVIRRIAASCILLINFPRDVSRYRFFPQFSNPPPLYLCASLFLILSGLFCRVLE